jgi:putative nucleotidyltransferase with HDIG domain
MTNQLIDHNLEALLTDSRKYTHENVQNILTMNTAQSLYETIRLRDHFTASHSLKVAVYSYLLAVKLDPDLAFEYFIGGLIHDVGKISFPDYILKGTSKFGNEERENIQKHVIDSITILSKLNMPPKVIRIARFHHERFNGSGYLEELSGYHIPIEGRITSIADIYSAITDEGRAYQTIQTHEQAILILENECSQFDPDILNTFLHIVEVIPDRYINTIESNIFNELQNNIQHLEFNTI